MSSEKRDRVLELFFRGFRGELLSVSELAKEFELSEKSISRDIRDLKAFLADHWELVGNTELVYNHVRKAYRLEMDEFLSSPELFALVEILIGARAFSKLELLELTEKLKRFTTTADRHRIQDLIRREMYHYPEIRHDCDSVEKMLWQLAACIEAKREISIEYYRMDRSLVTRRICPASVLFSDYYFYLIAFHAEDEDEIPYYFRVDRIRSITEHRSRLRDRDYPKFDEGLLRKRSLLMWPGKLRTIRFEFSGPSVQAVLDKLPTAKIIEKRPSGRYLIEAEVYGDGIRMWLLSQGSWVRVVSPFEFVEEMRVETEKMAALYASKEEA